MRNRDINQEAPTLEPPPTSKEYVPPMREDLANPNQVTQEEIERENRMAQNVENALQRLDVYSEVVIRAVHWSGKSRKAYPASVYREAMRRLWVNYKTGPVIDDH